MQKSFNYQDGFGGDSVAMSISFDELRRLAKLIDDEVSHGENDKK